MNADVDHQAVRDAVLHWWATRECGEEPFSPGEQVVYVGEQVAHRGEVGFVWPMVVPVEGLRAVRFGGLEDGPNPVVIIARVDELEEL